MAESITFDTIIIGAGPAGLSAAIRLKQLDASHSVCVLEKAAEIGAHSLSGAVLEPRALDDLLPNWRSELTEFGVEAISDQFALLTKRWALPLPTPAQMKNHGNVIISLGHFCRFLSKKAEALGVQVFSGFAAGKLISEEDRITGVTTAPIGLNEDGSKSKQYQEGIELKAKHTLFAEGCRGHLSQEIIKRYALDKGSDPQTYALGIKELWHIDSAKHKEGHILHTIGWPLDHASYGGSFIYHMKNQQLAIGLIVGLDYRNPSLSPYHEMQRLKTHPYIAQLLKDGKRIGYGARSLNEGGFQSIPKLTFPGGALIGCSAGFMNVLKIKGTHTAMQSATLAAEAICEGDLSIYEKKVKDSWMYSELYKARNIRPAFKAGLYGGLIYAALDSYILRGHAPWSFRHGKDHVTLKKDMQKTFYPKADHKITFDLASSLQLSGTYHRHGQKKHLILTRAEDAVTVNLLHYGGPEQYYCPAGVYEYLEKNNTPYLQINAQNCLHCKACDIKDPGQNITWTAPEGGDGPRYAGM